MDYTKYLSGLMGGGGGGDTAASSASASNTFGNIGGSETIVGLAVLGVLLLFGVLLIRSH